MIAIDTRKVHDFAAPWERGEDGKPKPGATVFKIKTLPSRKFLSLMPDIESLEQAPASEEVGKRVCQFADAAVRIVKTGVAGWSGLVDSDTGVQIAPVFDAETGELSDGSIDLLDLNTLTVLAKEVIDRNMPSPRELGN